jgi:hypothetical protein
MTITFSTSFSNGEGHMVEEAKTKFLLRKGMSQQEAEKITVGDFMHNMLWTIVENLCDYPPEYAAKKAKKH